MATYKLAKEYIFSNKPIAEIMEFVRNCDELNLLGVKDDEGSTPIHFCAFHNKLALMKKYVEYGEKSHNTEQILEWLNQPNQKGLTAAHCAAFRGHIPSLEYLRNRGADIYAVTPEGTNALHLASQTDKVQTMLYYRQLIDINSVDRKGSTALHWASYMGSQQVVEYLLSQPDIKMDEKDGEGSTALHLATYYGNGNIVRMLLIKGADWSIQNEKGETAVQIAQEQDFSRIEKMLRENKTYTHQLLLYCNLRNDYRPKPRTISQPLAFIITFLITCSLINGLFPLLPRLSILWYITIAHSCLTLLLYISLILPPTHNYQPISDYSLYLSNREEIKNICFYCERQKPSRSHHCNICKACIQMYDHHCPWIRNCVGWHNIVRYVGDYFRYTLFLLCFVLQLLYWLFFSIVLIEQEISSRYDMYQNLLSSSLLGYMIGVLLAVLSLVLGTPLLFLTSRQIKNLCINRTTYERFSSKPNLHSQQIQSSHSLCYSSPHPIKQSLLTHT